MAKHNVAELLVGGTIVCSERIDHLMSVRVSWARAITYFYDGRRVYNAPTGRPVSSRTREFPI